MKKDKSQYIKEFKSQKCCVVIPTYNNVTTLSRTIDDVMAYCEDIYIVNDGSTDNTLSVLWNYKDAIKIISYEKNKGKGNALLSGFRQAYGDGFKYAVTIDSDGQHYADDLPLFLDKIENEADIIILGDRQLNSRDLSKGSRFANKFSNFWFKVQTGISVPDTQTGFRLYPLAPINKMKFHSKKYEFEIEVLVRLSWKGYKILTVPINVYYFPQEERISHFRPVRDFLRISILNIVLTFLALLFFLPRTIVRENKNKKLKDIIKDNLIGQGTPNHIIAISIGFGVFMGIFPIWGYQLAVGFLLAHIFKLNKSIFFLFANISIPPMIPVILYFSYVLGGYIMGESSWTISIKDISLETISLKQYLVGAVSLATIAGITFGAVSYLILLLVNSKRVKK